MREIGFGKVNLKTVNIHSFLKKYKYLKTYFEL